MQGSTDNSDFSIETLLAEQVVMSSSQLLDFSVLNRGSLIDGGGVLRILASELFNGMFKVSLVRVQPRISIPVR